MAVAISTTDFPEGVGTQTYDGVNAVWTSRTIRRRA
jgi:hypothetical protein